MKERSNTQNYNSNAVLLSVLFCMGLLLVSVSAWADRYSYSDDGSQVIDSKTGLVWQRCMAGMSWNGTTCTGTAATYTIGAALVYAKTQTGWRLPHKHELPSIVDGTRRNPSIDTTVFPATPADWTWSAPSDSDNSGRAFTISFRNGLAGIRGGKDAVYVRLVRSSK